MFDCAWLWHSCTLNTPAVLSTSAACEEASNNDVMGGDQARSKAEIAADATAPDGARGKSCRVLRGLTIMETAEAAADSGYV